MANWQNVLTEIDNSIIDNNDELITAGVLRPVLKSMVQNVGMFYPYAGKATPGLDPGEPNGKCCYLATAKGLYPNFGNITITGEFAFLVWNTIEWSKDEVFTNQSDLANGGGNGVSQSILQLSNINADTTFELPANTWFEDIFAIDLSGAPMIAIGTSPGGVDVLDYIAVSGVTTVMIQQLFTPVTTFYVSLSNGSINLRIDIKSSLFVNTLDPFNPVTTYSKTEVNDLLDDKADKTDVLLLSGASPAEIPASEADLESGLSGKADKTDVLLLSGTGNANIPASKQDIEDINTDISNKADESNVLLKDAALAADKPASLADLGIQLLWAGNIDANGTVHKLKGSLIVTCINGSDGVYAFTHNVGSLDYEVRPGLGTDAGLVTPRRIFNKLATSFTIWTSSDNTKHNGAFQIEIVKYY